MKCAFSVTNTANVSKVKQEGMKLVQLMNEFADALAGITDYEAPRGFVFHDLESSTQVCSDHTLPAYTSRNLIHMTPLLDVLKDIFLSTVAGKDLEDVRRYYEALDIVDVATIAAHEFTHHSKCFHDDFDDIDEEAMWFEEGMCFYIPRKLMMSGDKFETIMKVEDELINAYSQGIWKIG